VIRCGKCHAREANLYRDDDTVTGLNFLACRICGNRWPGGKEPIREEEEMGKIGKCVNCAREMTIAGRGLCGGCYFAARTAGDDETKKSAALAACKERFQAGTTARGGARKLKERADAAIPQSLREIAVKGPAAPAVKQEIGTKKNYTVAVDAYPCVVLNFPGQDARIYEKIKEAAIRNRRAIDQEILYRLEVGCG